MSLWILLFLAIALAELNFNIDLNEEYKEKKDKAFSWLKLWGFKLWLFAKNKFSKRTI